MSPDGKMMYSVEYLSELERRLDRLLVKSLKIDVESVARVLGVSRELVDHLVSWSRRFVLHEDYVFNKLSKLSRRFANVPRRGRRERVIHPSRDLIAMELLDRGEVRAATRELRREANHIPGQTEEVHRAT